MFEAMFTYIMFVVISCVKDVYIYLGILYIGAGWNVDGSLPPLVSFISISSPDWSSKDSILLEVNIQISDIGSIHVKPKTQTLSLSSVDVEVWTLELSLRTTATTASFQIYVVPIYKRKQCTIPFVDTQKNNLPAFLLLLELEMKVKEIETLHNILIKNYVS